MAALSQGGHFPLTDRLIDCSRDALWRNNLTAVPVVHSCFSITCPAVDLLLKHFCRSRSSLIDAQCSLDTGESLPNHSYPLRWIVRGTIEISRAENLVVATQKRHDGNPRQSFPEMGDKLASFLPRSSVPDHNHSHGTI